MGSMQVFAEPQRCSDCGGSLIEDSTEVVCIKCGAVVESVVDSGPESHAYNPEDASKKARTGPPLSLGMHDQGLSTLIGGSKSRDNDQLLQAYQLRKWQKRSRLSDAKDHNLAVALAEMSRLSESLSLPRSVLDTSSVIYRRAIKKRLIRGRSIRNTVAAAIYMSSRQCGVPRTLDEIATAMILEKKSIGRDFRFLVRSLEAQVPASNPRSCAARLSNQLGISGRTEGIAMRILGVASQAHLTSGRGPQGLAAAAVYVSTVVMNERKTQREIAEIANVTEVTIRNRYKELLEKLMIEVPL